MGEATGEDVPETLLDGLVEPLRAGGVPTKWQLLIISLGLVELSYTLC